MICDNQSNKEKVAFEIDSRNARIAGATRIWTFNKSTIEWGDSLGYTYSLDRKSGLLHRVYPRTNTGYTFECRRAKGKAKPDGKS